MESQYATAGKSLSDGLTNDELTRCLCNFSSWVERGCRATIFEMNLAVGRSRVRMLQPVWDAINPRVRANVMRERFKIVFLEEAGTFDPKQLSHLRLTLERLAQQYPATKETTHAH